MQKTTSSLNSDVGELNPIRISSILLLSHSQFSNLLLTKSSFLLLLYWEIQIPNEIGRSLEIIALLCLLELRNERKNSFQEEEESNLVDDCENNATESWWQFISKNLRKCFCWREKMEKIFGGKK